MQLRDTPEEARFRHRLRDWLASTVPARDNEPLVPQTTDIDTARRWAHALYEAGYAGLTWPREHGGQGLTLGYQAIYLEETARAGAGEHVNVIGLGMVGPTLIAVGTPDQQHAYLPRILTGETLMCQGFSEPGAGSDLAAMATRATPDGDEFVLDGQKVWSSYATVADECLLLARSAPDSSRHRGLTCFLLDLRTPGVTVRPQRQLTGEPGFGEIILDQVRVPATRVLGGAGNGWSVAMTTLAHERGTFGFTLTARLERQLRLLAATIRDAGLDRDPVVRDRLATLHVEAQGLRWTSIRALGDGHSPGPESTVLKLRWSEANQRLTGLALDVLRDAADHPAAERWRSHWEREQLRSRANSIEGGSSEILRDIVAERILALPRSR
ncbi:acyl-CoA dehydrogenase family protein [Micromonospora sp. FIMYZ51]|uniref:acyl-CoA dehydrogenase family protein n=1 Tax=Micromonospora sp. FIMYZ51 TaxID=3051832 RepID=UPI00311E4AF5